MPVSNLKCQYKPGYGHFEPAAMGRFDRYFRLVKLKTLDLSLVSRNVHALDPHDGPIRGFESNSNAKGHVQGSALPVHRPQLLGSYLREATPLGGYVL
eukprot:6199657-Pleurochrysis_carterae.AAC.1